jgi:ribonuclease P protein component
MRLPVDLRLKASSDFAQVRAEGQSFPGRALVLGIRRSAKAGRFQFGLITSKKIGNAVVRNRVRRLLREIVRAEQTKLIDGIHLVIIARWRAPETSLEDLRRDFLKIAQRADILRPKASPTSEQSPVPDPA